MYNVITTNKSLYGGDKTLTHKQITNMTSYCFHIFYLSVQVKTCKSFFLVIDF